MVNLCRGFEIPLLSRVIYGSTADQLMVQQILSTVDKCFDMHAQRCTFNKIHVFFFFWKIPLGIDSFSFLKNFWKNLLKY